MECPHVGILVTDEEIAHVEATAARVAALLRTFEGVDEAGQPIDVSKEQRMDALFAGYCLGTQAMTELNARLAGVPPARPQA